MQVLVVWYWCNFFLFAFWILYKQWQHEIFWSMFIYTLYTIRYKNANKIVLSQNTKSHKKKAMIFVELIYRFFTQKKWHIFSYLKKNNDEWKITTHKKESSVKIFSLTFFMFHSLFFGGGGGGGGFSLFALFYFFVLFF